MTEIWYGKKRFDIDTFFRFIYTPRFHWVSLKLAPEWKTSFFSTNRLFSPTNYFFKLSRRLTLTNVFFHKFEWEKKLKIIGIRRWGLASISVFCWFSFILSLSLSYSFLFELILEIVFESVKCTFKNPFFHLYSFTLFPLSLFIFIPSISLCLVFLYWHSIFSFLCLQHIYLSIVYPSFFIYDVFLSISRIFLRS